MALALVILTEALTWSTSLTNHKHVAIKKIKADEAQEGISGSTLREVACLLELDHPNIIKILSILSDVDNMTTYLVYEWMDGDLHRLFKGFPQFLVKDLALVKKIMWQLLRGLDFCHRRRVIHR